MFTTTHAAFPSLSSDYHSWLADQIFEKECNREINCLTHWNEGEDFPSLGIGHFIWFRDGQQAAFEETFPQLLAYLQSHGVEMPTWAKDPLNADNPWPNREVFYEDYEQPALTELRDLLDRTRHLQAAFIVQRFETTAQQIIENSPAAQQAQVEQALHRVANARPPLGLYALIDYLHFKGSGLNPAEQYQGQGWGLQQVLSGMPDSGPALDAFVTSARSVLQRRVANSPPQRNEQRWLAGWEKRVQSYLNPSKLPDLAHQALSH